MCLLFPILAKTTDQLAEWPMAVGAKPHICIYLLVSARATKSACLCQCICVHSRRLAFAHFSVHIRICPTGRVGLREMCPLRGWVHAVQKKKILRQPAFPQNSGFRLGRDQYHGPAGFHLSFEDGSEENREGDPCSLARRVRDGPRVRACCMHTVVIAFRV